MVLFELMCTDYPAEMTSGLFKFGCEIPQGGMKRSTGSTPTQPTVVYGIRFIKTVAPKHNPNNLMEMRSPLPRRYADFASDPDNDPEAEYLPRGSELIGRQAELSQLSRCSRWGATEIGRDQRMKSIS